MRFTLARPHRAFLTHIRVNTAAVQYLQRTGVEHKLWRRRKHGFARCLLRVVHNGITVSKIHTSSMLSNTCCTALLIQGAPVSPP